MADTQPAFEATGSGGATVQALYMGRTMKCYPVHETEMESMSEANGDTTSHYAFASACLAFAVGIWTNAIFSTQLTAAGELATKLGAPFLLVVAIYFGALGMRAAARRNRLWTKIKSEAVTLQAAASVPVATSAQSA